MAGIVIILHRRQATGLQDPISLLHPALQIPVQEAVVEVLVVAVAEVAAAVAAAAPEAGHQEDNQAFC